MDQYFYTRRTHRLLKTGYPIALITADLTDGSVVSLHSHEEVEFLYAIKGTAQIACGGDDLLVTGGDILFINQSVKHGITPVDREGGIFSSITIHPGFLFCPSQLEMENKYIFPVITNSALAYLYITSRDQDYARFLPLLKQMFRLNEQKDAGYELLSKSCALQMWKLVYDRIPAETDVPLSPEHMSGQDAQRVKQAMDFIHEHYGDTITLGDIAGEILVSKSECCRCFQRTLGLSPIEYLMKYRVSEAVQRMNRNTQESVSEIASRVGFNNASYFNKVFKKYMECTPTQYRKSLHKETPKL